MNDLGYRYWVDFSNSDSLCTLPTMCVHSPGLARLSLFLWDAKISLNLRLSRSFLFNSLDFIYKVIKLRKISKICFPQIIFIETYGKKFGSNIFWANVK